MPAVSPSSDRFAQLKRGSLAVRDFQLSIVQASSKHEADDYRGDKVAFKSVCQVPCKRLSGKLLSKNYFHHYLAYLESPDDLQARTNFMEAKLEKTRFLQSAGVQIFLPFTLDGALPYLLPIQALSRNTLVHAHFNHTTTLFCGLW